MRLQTKIFAFILTLIGVSLWISIHFSSKAVTEALSAQIADGAAAAAVELSASFGKALIPGANWKPSRPCTPSSRKRGLSPQRWWRWKGP